MRELLLHEEISPAKLVRIVEKENKLLSICYVMLIECIKYAGKMVAENKKATGMGKQSFGYLYLLCRLSKRSGK